MKKILISIGVLSVMSFTTNSIINIYAVHEAITNIQDMKEWMLQDVESGKIDPELGEHYMFWLEASENELIDFCNKNKVTK